MKFPVKKDIWIGLIFWISIIGVMWGFISSIINRDWFGILSLPLVIVLLLLFWFRTYYKIIHHTLYIIYGPCEKQISIKNIYSIRPTKSILATPSLALSRLEINTNQYETIQISPKNTASFIQALLEIQPNINMIDDK